MTFPETRFYVPFRINTMTMLYRMPRLGSVFDIAFPIARSLVSVLLRSRPLPPTANLKAIGIYHLQEGVLLGQVECKIRTTSTGPIKAL
jgi:hypothetical protein